MPHERVNLQQVRVLPLDQRASYLNIEEIAIDLDAESGQLGGLETSARHLAERIRAARERGAAVMLAYGAHLIKNGCGPLLIALMREGWLTHLATQGAGIIHDLEFAHTGSSSESVRDNAPVGRFGTWDQTGRFINLAAVAGGVEGLGFGEAVGALMARGGWTLPDPDALARQITEAPQHPLAAARADLLGFIRDHETPLSVTFASPFGQYSVTQNAYEQGIPLTVHPGIGYDIFNCHPMFHGGAIGRAAGIDFRVYARGVMNLSGGVYLSIGSAVMSPQVFEKAFSVANNLRQHAGLPFLQNHTIGVVDIQDDGGWNWAERDDEPPMDHPAYYLRWCKTFHRMGGEFRYIHSDNRRFLSALLWLLRQPD